MTVDSFRQIYRMSRKIFKFCPFLNNQHLSSHKCNGVPQQAPQVYCYILHLYLQKLVQHFKRPRDFLFQWRYVYDRAVDDTACRVVTLSHRPVVRTAFSCRLQCATSHSKQTVESHRKLIVSPSYTHRTLSRF